MAVKFTEEQLNTFDKSLLIQLLVDQQEQNEKLTNELHDLNEKLQLIMEQLVLSNKKRFGTSSEKMDIENQICFFEKDGTICFFNESEAVCVLTAEEPDDLEQKPVKKKKCAGKKEEDISGLPVNVISHYMSDEELTAEFGENGWKQLPDMIAKRYHFTPAKVEVDEHHVGVYASKSDGHMVKADHPKALLHGSLVSPSLAAAVMNGKYVNAVPLYRLEQEFARYGLSISRKNMANWMIRLGEEYLGVLYDYHETRNSSHPREFLKDYSGICVTDGYQVYHTIEKELESLRIAGCWVHARRKFDEALEVLPKEQRKKSNAFLVMSQIQAIYREEGKLKDLSSKERLVQRQLVIKPLVDALFVYLKQQEPTVPKSGQLRKAYTYILNQEAYLRVFLEDGDVPMDNNASERAIRGFCIGKNYVLKNIIVKTGYSVNRQMVLK